MGCLSSKDKKKQDFIEEPEIDKTVVENSQAPELEHGNSDVSSHTPKSDIEL